MRFGVAGLFDQAELLISERRLIPARETLELARQLTRIPDRRAWATFHLGMLHWTFFGNGERARREFLAAIAEFEALDGQSAELRLWYAGALENAMLCALSFDEFEQLATRLRALTPDMPILTGLVPPARDARERGQPWSQMLLDIASGYYDRTHPDLDRGRYGEAKSTYHLLLTQRRVLRLSREQRRFALAEFCALSMRLSADCMKARGGDADQHSPEEFLPIVTEALPLVDEYLSGHSGDDAIRRQRDCIQGIVDSCRRPRAHRSAVSQPSLPSSASAVIQEGDVLPRTVFSNDDVSAPELRISVSRLVSSAMWWGTITFSTNLILIPGLSDIALLAEIEKQAYANALWGFAAEMALYGGGVGVVLPIWAAAVAKRWSERATGAAVLICSIGMGVLLTWWYASLVVSDALTLRPALQRIAIGAFLGFLAGGASFRKLFKRIGR